MNKRITDSLTCIYPTLPLEWCKYTYDYAFSSCIKITITLEQHDFEYVHVNMFVMWPLLVYPVIGFHLDNLSFPSSTTGASPNFSTKTSNLGLGNALMKIHIWDVFGSWYVSYTIFILSAICALFRLFRFRYPNFHLYSWFLFFSYDIPFISLVLFVSYSNVSDPDPDPDFDFWHMILWLLLVLLLFILISGFKYFPSFSDSIPTHSNYFTISPCMWFFLLLFTYLHYDPGPFQLCINKL